MNDKMWNENDKMMERIGGIEHGHIHSPATCPICSEHHAHFLMHADNETTGKGTAWIWCDACKSYSHFSYFVPDWWKNPPFVDVAKLDSRIDYPHSIEGEIDKWTNALASSETDGEQPRHEQHSSPKERFEP